MSTEIQAHQISLRALHDKYPILQLIVVASAIKPEQWYFHEGLLLCQHCQEHVLSVFLVVGEEAVLEAMSLWPEAVVDRNTMFDWRKEP